MADISMCTNLKCPLKEKCYRQTAPVNPYGQSYADFSYNEEKEHCDYFWDNSGYKKNEKVSQFK